VRAARRFLLEPGSGNIGRPVTVTRADAYPKEADEMPAPYDPDDSWDEPSDKRYECLPPVEDLSVDDPLDFYDP
jgi:hypothetical protein